ncbi:MAG TPA: polysaccharide deacetylase family protein [Steroidobacteraceae bacterium]|nr:polysaccharide deacetylase family protein [Steroidobacteraceae bacterium]
MNGASSSAVCVRWRASLLLRASVGLHIGAALLTVIRPHWWPWTLSAVIANHLLLTALGLWPRSQALGSNWTSLPAAAAARGEVAITIDDGPDPVVTPQVLAVLKRYEARATFFCIGQPAQRHAECVRECFAAGHAIENHSYQHRHNFSLLGPSGMQREIARAQQTLNEVSGSAPRFFRAPAGLRNPFLDPVLQRLQLQLVSWTRRGFDTVNGDADVVYARLVRGLKAGDILLLHDGHAARTTSGGPLILEVLPRLLETIRQHSLTPVTLRDALR